MVINCYSIMKYGGFRAHIGFNLLGALEARLRLFFTGYEAALVTSSDKRIIITCSK